MGPLIGLGAQITVAVQAAVVREAGGLVVFIVSALLLPTHAVQRMS